VLGTLGRRFLPPFERIGKDESVLKSHPSFYWVIGNFIHPLFALSDEMTEEKKIQLVSRCTIGLDMFLREPAKDMLPRSTEKALGFAQVIQLWMQGRKDGGTIKVDTLQRTLNGFMVSLQDELDRLPTFTVTRKGNLSIDSLVDGASNGYPESVLELIDESIVNEINQAGKCLAFELPTSSGFHILRSVEIGIKGYVHAVTGALPKINNRNWGEYIHQLELAGCGSDFTDVLKILKTKRNPLMHPQDSLEIDEAVSLFCICQAGMESLINDVRKRSLETQFKASLKVLPTL
jgi:hypothetical protein